MAGPRRRRSRRGASGTGCAARGGTGARRAVAAGRVRAVLFDRDGTLVHDVPYNGDPDAVRPVDGRPRGARPAARARHRGRAWSATSPASARGLLTREQVEAVNAPGRGAARSVRHLAGAARTPRTTGARCRKPQPGHGARRSRRARASRPERGRGRRATSAPTCEAAAGRRGRGRAGADAASPAPRRWPRRRARPPRWPRPSTSSPRGGRPRLTRDAARWPCGLDSVGDVLLAGPAVRAVAAGSSAVDAAGRAVRRGRRPGCCPASTTCWSSTRARGPGTARRRPTRPTSTPSSRRLRRLGARTSRSSSPRTTRARCRWRCCCGWPASRGSSAQPRLPGLAARRARTRRRRRPARGASAASRLAAAAGFRRRRATTTGCARASGRCRCADLGLPGGYVVRAPARVRPAAGRSTSSTPPRVVDGAGRRRAGRVVVDRAPADRARRAAGAALAPPAGAVDLVGPHVVRRAGRRPRRRRAASSRCNTGPAHLAAAVGTPVVSLFSPVVAGRARGRRGACRTWCSATRRRPARGTRGRALPGAGPPVPGRRGTAAGGRVRAGRAAAARTRRGGGGVRVLLWHVHGSWTTAFVAGRGTTTWCRCCPTAAPTGAAGPAPGTGRRRSWRCRRDAAGRRARRTSSCCSARTRPPCSTSWTGLRAGVDVPAVYVEHDTPRGDVDGMRHPLADQTAHPGSCTSPRFNAMMWDSGRRRRPGGRARRPRPRAPLDRRAPGAGRRRQRAGAALAGGRHGPRRRGLAAAACPVDVYGMGTDGCRRRRRPAFAARRARRPAAGRAAPGDGRSSAPTCTPTAGPAWACRCSRRWCSASPVLALSATEAPEAVPPGGRVVSNDPDGPAPQPRRAGWHDPVEAPRRGRAAPRARPRPLLGSRASCADWDRAAGGGGLMRIAMVSEHASPLAALGGVDAGGQNVHVAALADGLAAPRPRGRRLHPPRRPGPARAGAARATGVDVVHVPPARRGRCPRTTCCPHMGDVGAMDWRRPGPTARDAGRRARPLLDVGRSPPATALRRRRAGCPLAVTFHALGVVKRRHQGAADTSPPSGCGSSAACSTQADAVVATCRDEVRELLALGADPRRLHVVAVRRRPRPVHAGTGRPASRRGGPGRRRLLLPRAAGRAQGRRDRDRGARAAARRRAGRGRRPGRRATWTEDPDAPAAGRAARGAAASPTACTLLGRVGHADVAGPDARGRRRGRRPLVRAVRHRPARGDGLRHTGRRLGGRRDARHRRARRDRRCTCRRATRGRWPRRCASWSPTRAGAAPRWSRRRRPGAAHATRWPRVAAHDRGRLRAPVADAADRGSQPVADAPRARRGGGTVTGYDRPWPSTCATWAPAWSLAGARAARSTAWGAQLATLPRRRPAARGRQRRQRRRGAAPHRRARRPVRGRASAPVGARAARRHLHGDGRLQRLRRRDEVFARQVEAHGRAGDVAAAAHDQRPQPQPAARRPSAGAPCRVCRSGR